MFTLSLYIRDNREGSAGDSVDINCSIVQHNNL